MQVEILTPMADALGRSYRPGRRYEMDADEAKRLIAAGYAKVIDDAGLVVNLLTAQGGGLLITKQTTKALVAAAKKAGIRTRRV